MRTASERHWPELDGWRGLAVAGVVAYHLGWLDGGFLGVDLFFVLSGFLITGLLVDEHERTGRVALGSFWARRARRLLPAVGVLLVLVLAWLARWGTASEQALARADARWALPYLANWHLIADSRNYWAAATEASVFNHLWSLAIEEQFYLLWPLVVVVLLGRRHRTRRLALGTTVLTVLSLAALVVLGTNGDQARVYFGTDTRALALLLGALAALPASRRTAASFAIGHRRAAVWLIGAASVALAALWWRGGSWLDVLLRGGLALHSALAAVVIALTVALSTAPAPGGVRRILATRVITYLGTRSYGLYLWHWPVIVLGASRLDAWGPMASDVAVVALALALAEVSYQVVEHPIRRRTGWAVRRRADLATAAVTAVALAAIVVAPSGEGDIARFDAASVGASPTTTSLAPSSPTSTVPESAFARIAVVATTTADTATTATPTTAAISTTSIATTTTGTASPVVDRRIAQVLWIGDSIAADLAPALVARFAASDVVLHDGGLDGARLVPSDGIDTDTLYDEMLRDHPADVIVVQLMLWDSPFSSDELRAAYRRFAARSRETGADLLIVTPPPVRDDLVDPGLDRQIAIVGELVAADPEHVRLIDATALWGERLDIDIGDDAAPDRKPDGVHVCPQGAARFAAWLAAELSTRYDGLTTADATWMAGAWTTNARYDTPVGACASLSSG